MTGNYGRMAAAARALFLTKDQGAMIALWGLRHDGDHLYASYFGEPMEIDRRTGAVSSLAAAGVYRPTDYVGETMALFDLLTYPAARPRASGRWASVNDLGGVIGAGHDRSLSNAPLAARFAGDVEGLRAACERMGGLPLGKADAGYVIPVFADFSIWFQFWDADDEFPAGIRYLFDENALRYMRYETLWYVMGGASERLVYYYGRVRA